MGRQEARGTSLLEVAVALVLVMVLLLGLFSMVSMSRKSRSFNNERDLAREAARGKLEEILAAPFGTVNAFDGELEPVTGLTSSVPGEEALRVTIANGPVDGVLTATVEVRWRGISGESEFELTTLVTSRDGT